MAGRQAHAATRERPLKHLHVDLARVSEPGSELPGLRVERQQPSVSSPDDDLRRNPGFTGPVRDASCGGGVAEVFGPQLLARVRVQRNEAAVGGRQVHHTVDDQRRSLRLPVPGSEATTPGRYTALVVASGQTRSAGANPRRIVCTSPYTTLRDGGNGRLGVVRPHHLEL